MSFKIGARTPRKPRRQLSARRRDLHERAVRRPQRYDYRSGDPLHHRRQHADDCFDPLYRPDPGHADHHDQSACSGHRLVQQHCGHGHLYPYPAQAATPTFSPIGGTYTSAQSVTLSDTTSGAAIHYTTDGSTPTAASTTYTVPIPVTATTTINAMATAGGLANSAVATATYTLAGRDADLQPVGGTYNSAQSVTLSDTTSGAAIHYTTDGSTPTTASTTYTVPIPVTATTTIYAMATAGGLANSAVATATYTLQAATPTFSPDRRDLHERAVRHPQRYDFRRGDPLHHRRQHADDCFDPIYCPDPGHADHHDQSACSGHRLV